MHERQIPESGEPGERVSQRAVEALQYEERAGLGFRRRTHGLGDPYADPDAYLVDRELSIGQVWGGYLGGAAVVLGVGAFVYKPLLLGLLAVFAGIGGLIAGGPAARTARLGLIVASAGFFFGMLLMIVIEKPVA